MVCTCFVAPFVWLSNVRTDNNITSLEKGLCPPSLSHRGPHPADSGGLGGSRAELVESQRRWGAREQAILKQPPALDALGSQALIVLPQELHGVVVLPQTSIAIPLAPQLGSHARRINVLLHPELVELTASGQLSASVGMFVCVELQYDVKMSQ